ncbi:hypothetical protein CRG98_040430 [Punica granatum]|uniref:Reverse transcriptase domain-containing protein n=1 Tax=Punica granatum TaxID=22663 RepID=A0A2I0I5B1_PUNGR|nr:hypothetical protein CRG98_040430 [Punica granatum]
MKSAQEILNNPKELYGENSGTARYEISKELFRTRMQEGTDVGDHAKVVANKGTCFRRGKDGHWKRNCPQFLALMNASKGKKTFGSLEALDFPPRFPWWIKGCITSPYFSVAINRTLAGYFPGKHGVRQGDPISPYLFVIAMEVFSHIMDSAAAEGKVDYHPRCMSLQLTRLCFADDLLLFTNASKESLIAILDVLNTSYHWSSLKLNPEKFEIFTGGISRDSVYDLATCSLKEAYYL